MLFLSLVVDRCKELYFIYFHHFNNDYQWSEWSPVLTLWLKNQDVSVLDTVVTTCPTNYAHILLLILSLMQHTHSNCLLYHRLTGLAQALVLRPFRKCSGGWWAFPRSKNCQPPLGKKVGWLGAKNNATNLPISPENQTLASKWSSDASDDSMSNTSDN